MHPKRDTVPAAGFGQIVDISVQDVEIYGQRGRIQILDSHGKHPLRSGDCSVTRTGKLSAGRGLFKEKRTRVVFPYSLISLDGACRARQIEGLAGSVTVA